MTKRPLVLCLTAITVALLTSRGSAQSKDPHLPQPTSIPSLNEYVQVDDMLFTQEQFQELTAPPVSHRQAYPYAIGRRDLLWEWGVIPYEFAPNFSEAEKLRIRGQMDLWQTVAPVLFVPRTTQIGFLAVTRDEVADAITASPCFGSYGHTPGQVQRLNLGSTCSSSVRTISHELGHVLGLYHEHQRPDRDDYLIIDLGNVAGNARYAFDKYGAPLAGPYDFDSVMHYASNAFALDLSRPTMSPRPQYASQGARMGLAVAPSATDHNVVALIYNQQLSESTIRVPTEAARNRFAREDMLLAMERLHGFYMSRMGLNRPQGLSLDGKPDFLGIAQWIFDIYLPARSAGFSANAAFDIVAAAITRTDEWRQKNSGRTPLTPASFRPTVSFNRDEFLDVLNHLDRFYAAPEGLQRANGLSIAGGPDFLGIATWIFDIYLSERLNGISPNGAWTITENAIRATDEWRSKH